MNALRRESVCWEIASESQKLSSFAGSAAGEALKLGAREHVALPDANRLKRFPENQIVQFA
jgi:hypothetical protein